MFLSTQHLYIYFPLDHVNKTSHITHLTQPCSLYHPSYPSVCILPKGPICAILFPILQYHHSYLPLHCAVISFLRFSFLTVFSLLVFL